MADIAIVSAGSFGTALAIVLSNNGQRIRLLVRETDTYEGIKAVERNPTYLPGFSLNTERIYITMDMEDAVRGVNYIFLTVPSQYVRQTMKELESYLEPKAIVVLTSKGMIENGDTMSEVAMHELPESKLCGIYGIMFAKFIARGEGLSSMCVASSDESVANDVAKLFVHHTSNHFCIYISSDLRGAEFGGAMKTVYATAMGIFDGYLDFVQKEQGIGEFGIKASRHSLLNLSMMEFLKFGLAHGARIHTLLGPSGIGDIEACANNLSRNYRYGRWRASLEFKKDVQDAAPEVHEGYDTVKAAMKRAKEYNLGTPILKAAHDILYAQEKIKVVVPRLLNDLAVTVDMSEDNEFSNRIHKAIENQKIIPMPEPARVFETAFISYKFESSESRKCMNLMEGLLDFHGIKVTTGIAKGPQTVGETVSAGIRKKIRDCSLYCGIFLNDNLDNRWLIEERAIGGSFNKPMLIFVEEGTPREKLWKLDTGHQYYKFTKENFASIVEKEIREIEL